MKTDWFPRTAAAELAFYQNLVKVLPAIATTIKLDAATATAGVAAAQKLIDARLAFDAAKLALKAASDTLAAQDKLSEANTRKLAQTVRSTPGVTPAQLAQLLMTGAEAATPTGAEARVAAQVPELKLSLDGGQIKVEFKKSGHQGIHLYSRRGAETEFTFLGADTYSPYLDTRPNLTPGQAEQRDYYAFFMDHDAANGAQSATFGLAVS
jgi:hypothetical protein